MNAREFLDLLDAYQGVYELDEAMMDGPRKDKMIAKQHSPYASSRDRATAFNVGVRDERPRDKKSTGGKGERYSDFGDRGAGNKSRRRRGLEPIHGNTRKEEVDLYDLILTHLLDEGYADTEESATAIMANMSEDWRDDILDESAANQSDKQIDKGVKTTYKAQNVLDNLHQGRSRGVDRVNYADRDAKVKRMRGRLKTRRDDLFGERNKREDESRAEMKKKYGI
jgi:hypothetical protein